MKHSAASLSDRNIVHLKSSLHERLVLVDLMSFCVFEGVEFEFKRTTEISVRVLGQDFLLNGENHIGVTVNEFCRIEVWSECTPPKFSVYSFRKLCFGVKIDLNDSLFGQVTFERMQDCFYYDALTDQTCLLNGKVVSSSGTFKEPCLFQIGLFAVFAAADALVMNLFDQKDQIPVYPIKVNEFNPVYQRYVSVAETDHLELHLPQFLPLPETRGFSIFSMGPMLTMSCASLISALLSYEKSGNKSSLIMPAMMLFSAVFWPSLSAFAGMIQQFRMKRKRRKTYLNACDELLKKIAEEKEKQKNSIISCEQIKPFSLWQIRRNHPQFNQLIVGKGKVSFQIQVHHASQLPDVSEKKCLKVLDQILCEVKSLNDGWIVCDLNRHSSVVLCAPQHRCHDVMDRLIVSFTSLMDIHFCSYVLFASDESFLFAYRKSLLFYRLKRVLIVDESVSISEAEKMLNQLMERNVICFVLDRLRFQQISSVLRQKMKVIYVLSLDDIIPYECSYVIKVSSDFSLNGSQGTLIFQDSSLFHKKKEVLLHSRTVDEGNRNFHPDSFFDFYQNLSSEIIAKNWENTKDPVGYLGWDEHGERIELNLSEKADGPHGLIAGTTGSGKSVLLLNFLFTLALNCSCEQVQFLIIDFKGGALQQHLQYKEVKIPHLSGSFSNQSKLIGRTLASIGYECSLRQKLFLKASEWSGKTVSTLEEYRLVKNEFNHLPHLAQLIVVVDEFAELKKEEPEFLKTLISFSRIGRSLGLHLILCTQKISGVVDDEIIANARFKIAMKTAKTSELTQLLESSFEWTPVKPGEFLFGKDHMVRFGRAPNCLKSLDNTDHQRIRLCDGSGRVIASAYGKTEGSLKISEQLVQMICEANRRKGIKPVSLWLEPLSSFDGNRYLVKNQVLIGLCDLPEICEQKPLYLNKHEHLLLCYETERQKKDLVFFFLNQFINTQACFYVVQLNSSIVSQQVCIHQDGDLMERFLKKMSAFQQKQTFLIVDDLCEFLDCFDSVSSMVSFLFKAIQRNIQVIALLRRPVSLSSLILDQFSRKAVFGELSDAEALSIFHMRKNSVKTADDLQGYCEVDEKLCVLQVGEIKRNPECRSGFRIIKYLPSFLRRQAEQQNVLGISIQTLKEIQWDVQKKLVVTGMDFHAVRRYSLMLQLKGEIVDSLQFQRNYTKDQINEWTVLWVGPQFHLQLMIPFDLTQKLPASFQEGVVVQNGKMELVRLFDGT